MVETSLATLMVRIVGDPTGLTAAVATAKGEVAGLGTSISKLSNIGLAGVTAPIVAIGAVAIKSAMDVQSAYKQIQGATGETGAAMDSLKNSFNNVAAGVPQSFGQVATAISEVHDRLGLTGTALDNFSTQMLNLARITGTDVKGDVDALTSSFIAWGIQADQMSSKADELYTLSTKVGVGVDDLATLLGKVAGPAKQAGMSFEQAGVMMGEMAIAGIPARQAVAMINTEVVNSIKNGKDATTEWNNFMNRLKDPSYKITAEDIKEFGTQIVKFANATTETRSKWAGLMSDMANSPGAINKTAAATLTFGQQLDIFKNKAELAFAPLGTTLLKILTNFLTSMTPVITAIGNAVTAFGKLPQPIQNVVIAVAAIAAGLPILGAALGAVQTVVGTVTVAYTALTTALGLNSAAQTADAAAVATDTTALTAEGAAGDTAAVGIGASGTAAIAAEGAMVGLAAAIGGVVIAYEAMKYSADAAAAAAAQVNANAAAAVNPNSASTQPSSTQPATNTGNIPGYGNLSVMQHGGIVTKETLAILAEAGPEAVVPLSSSGGGEEIRSYFKDMVDHLKQIKEKTIDLSDTARNNLAAAIQALTALITGNVQRETTNTTLNTHTTPIADTASSTAATANATKAAATCGCGGGATSYGGGTTAGASGTSYGGGCSGSGCPATASNNNTAAVQNNTAAAQQSTAATQQATGATLDSYKQYVAMIDKATGPGGALSAESASAAAYGYSQTPAYIGYSGPLSPPGGATQWPSDQYTQLGARPLSASDIANASALETGWGETTPTSLLPGNQTMPGNYTAPSAGNVTTVPLTAQPMDLYINLDGSCPHCEALKSALDQAGIPYNAKQGSGTVPYAILPNGDRINYTSSDATTNSDVINAYRSYAGNVTSSSPRLVSPTGTPSPSSMPGATNVTAVSAHGSAPSWYTGSCWDCETPDSRAAWLARGPGSQSDTSGGGFGPNLYGAFENIPSAIGGAWGAIKPAIDSFLHPASPGGSALLAAPMEIGAKIGGAITSMDWGKVGDQIATPLKEFMQTPPIVDLVKGSWAAGDLVTQGLSAVNNFLFPDKTSYEMNAKGVSGNVQIPGTGGIENVDWGAIGNQIAAPIGKITGPDIATAFINAIDPTHFVASTFLGGILNPSPTRALYTDTGTLGTGVAEATSAQRPASWGPESITGGSVGPLGVGFDVYSKTILQGLGLEGQTAQNKQIWELMTGGLGSKGILAPLIQGGAGIIDMLTGGTSTKAGAIGTMVAHGGGQLALGESTPVDWGKTDNFVNMKTQSDKINTEIKAIQASVKAGGDGLIGVYKQSATFAQDQGKLNTEIKAQDVNTVLGTHFLENMGLHLDQFGNILNTNNQLIAKADQIITAGIVAQQAEMASITAQEASLAAQVANASADYSGNTTGASGGSQQWTYGDNGQGAVPYYGDLGGYNNTGYTTGTYAGDVAVMNQQAADYNAAWNANSQQINGAGLPGSWQSGGIATKATLGIFGEAGMEALLPLTKLQPMMNDAVTQSVTQIGRGAQTAHNYSGNSLSDVFKELGHSIGDELKEIFKDIFGGGSSASSKWTKSKTLGGGNTPTVGPGTAKYAIKVDVNNADAKKIAAEIQKRINRLEILSNGVF